METFSRYLLGTGATKTDWSIERTLKPGEIFLIGSPKFNRVTRQIENTHFWADFPPVVQRRIAPFDVYKCCPWEWGNCCWKWLPFNHTIFSVAFWSSLVIHCNLHLARGPQARVAKLESALKIALSLFVYLICIIRFVCVNIWDKFSPLINECLSQIRSRNEEFSQLHRV